MWDWDFQILMIFPWPQPAKSTAWVLLAYKTTQTGDDTPYLQVPNRRHKTVEPTEQEV